MNDLSPIIQSAPRGLDPGVYKVLFEAAESIASCRNLATLLHDIRIRLQEIVKFDGVSVLLYDPISNRMRMHLLDSTEGPWRESFIQEIPVDEAPGGWVWQTQQPMLITNIDEIEERYPRIAAELRQFQVETAFIFPMTSSGRRLGAVGFGSFRPHAWSIADREFLQYAANLVAIAVDNTINFENAREAEREAARRLDQLRMLLDVGKSIASHLELRDLMKVVADRLRRVIRCDGVGMTLLDEKTGALQVFSLDPVFRENPPLVEGGSFSADGTPGAMAMSSGQTIRQNRAELEASRSPMVRAVVASGVQSGCVAPLISKGRVIGTIDLASRQDHSFSEEDADLLTQVASQVAIAVENAKAYREIEALKNKLASEKLYLEDEIRTQNNFEEIIGASQTFRRILKQVETVAPTDSTVLIRGETGTGKELIARAIHELSGRRERTMVKINCAAIPTGLLESELFGHERGAFTGAIAQRVGRFELANRGTLFLDEVGDIPLDLQPKLLRVLQEQEFERLGSARTQKVDVRLIAATNADLATLADERKYRSDLYYRLNVFPITIPPLRDRREDVPSLVRFFTARYARRLKKRIDAIPTDAMDALCNYHWPGNVRELEHFIERAVILTQGESLDVSMSDLKVVRKSQPEAAPIATLETAERDHILRALEDTDWVIGGPAGAAARLGMKRTTLQSRMQKLGISRPR